MVSQPASARKPSGEAEPVAAEATGQIRRGDIFWAHIPGMSAKTRGEAFPVLVIQNDLGNRYSNTVIVAAISSRLSGKDFPVSVQLPPGLLAQPAEVRASRLHTLDKAHLGPLVGRVPAKIMISLDEAVRLSLGLPRFE